MCTECKGTKSSMLRYATLDVNWYLWEKNRAVTTRQTGQPLATYGMYIMYTCAVCSLVVLCLTVLLTSFGQSFKATQHMTKAVLRLHMNLRHYASWCSKCPEEVLLLSRTARLPGVMLKHCHNKTQWHLSLTKWLGNFVHAVYSNKKQCIQLYPLLFRQPQP